ncbi:MAG: ACT domain-containing protein [Clostridia bacterium]|nr:ACT domain-containing protein [Clostridia bacterium]
MNKAVVSILGADRIGIIAAVSGYLADNNINILDISQTIMEEMFTMVTMVDLSGTPKPFDEIYDDMKKLGDKLGVTIQIQKTEIFDSMHKI